MLINDLPRSLGRLHNLETLDVRGTKVEILPSGIANIRRLIHLLLRNMKIHSPNMFLVKMPGEIENLHLLQTLSGVETNMHLLA